MCGTLGEDVDTFVVNSQFYLDKMSTRLSIDSGKFQVNPLTIDTSPYVRAELSHVHQRESKEVNDDGFRLGYLARIAPEKGFHRLVDAFIELANDQAHSELSLHVAGWLGATNEAYFDEQRRKIQLAGLAERFTYHGSPDIAGKVNFLSSVDLLSVPTEYEDPKGLFVLEANAAGVPVVQPAHGAFTELVASTGGGITIPPNDHDALVAAIADMKSRDEHRQHLGRRGRDTVHDKHAIKHAAAQLVSLWND